MIRSTRTAWVLGGVLIPLVGMGLMRPAGEGTAAEPTPPAAPAPTATSTTTPVTTSATTPAKTSRIGQSVGDFELVDVRTGKPVARKDFGNRKAIAVIFMGTTCPINNAYLPRLNQYQRQFGDRVQILGINSNSSDTVARAAEHATRNELQFPVLKDPSGAVALKFGATRTPEAFVIDATGVIRYHGRIDDQYGLTEDGFDIKRISARTSELRDALEAVTAGKSVEVAETTVSGCYITRPPRPKATGQVTYFRHVAPLIQKHCQECHRSGQIGPMELTNYDQIAEWSEMVRDVISDERMPPWYADPKYGHFSNDRSMPAEDAATILKWIDDGCPKGDAKDAPPEKVYPQQEWTIGKPDVVLTMPTAFPVPAEMPRRGLPYQLFIIDPGFEKDMWVQAAEAKAGAPTVVHHILAFIAPPLSGVDPNIPDFPFLPLVKNARVLCGTAPGDMPTVFPPGVAIKIPAGSKIIIQMHYTPNGKAEKDLSSIGLIFAKEPPKRQVLTIPVFNARVRIPPGDSNHRMDSYFTTKFDGEILSYMPHMHLRGKSFTMGIRPGGTGDEKLLLSVPRYNFNWQNVYRNVTPVKFQKGDVIHCVAYYDNSEKNPNNPDPMKEVRWGDQTWEEMMIGWMDIVYNIPVNSAGK
ncbi:redoxin domain-containing protein [Tuwongella immobilis]|uniref:Thioredoxin domain-containing protein n=1 Tax=Tuwongella immobilis TaxID=692036 RepID=A0A6C2YLE1_9BACT|nr:redoxin domain-containing protein [Tuwongella immobilis]VIP01732.1 thiol-disulfide oxidoreductase : Peroxiredoxin OS=Singulisphaera acidiphila (strain ATCC BAA-1392 / DSM 18658 / VKM B-2454 / MOB10) GN=Sinac_4821 PE=4 SV=1: AhpC-TSA: Cu2_monoox_C [Tuwongella immobilis]VTR99284.1 thiol-disulfide oxidoreductase : Peroxiredoxin OS=Singulisphaera acidiphila (strain ATCC BAA-1392 / DSM 18658 / VKM B-2454 / MOB10) GN=Sinac_4821 PE=4 SV=1: AhpC-TSA: Cu2_monoox_C [Tuwongella immobilis]